MKEIYINNLIIVIILTSCLSLSVIPRDLAQDYIFLNDDLKLYGKTLTDLEAPVNMVRTVVTTLT